MKKFVLFCMVFILAVTSSTICFANEKKDHVCFRRIDANQDGVVTFQEFKQVLGDDKAKYKKFDQDNNGKLTHDEYHEAIGR